MPITSCIFFQSMVSKKDLLSAFVKLTGNAPPIFAPNNDKEFNLTDTVTLNKATPTTIYIADNDYTLTQIEADGKDCTGKSTIHNNDQGTIIYTIYFSDNTSCNLIWESTEHGLVIKDTSTSTCTQKMREAIKEYVLYQYNVTTLITPDDSKHKKLIQSIIKNINIENINQGRNWMEEPDDATPTTVPYMQETTAPQIVADGSKLETGV